MLHVQWHRPQDATAQNVARAWTHNALSTVVNKEFCQSLQRMIMWCLSGAKGTPNSANEPPRAQNRDSGSSAVEGLHCQEKGEAAQ